MTNVSHEQVACNDVILSPYYLYKYPSMRLILQVDHFINSKPKSQIFPLTKRVFMRQKFNKQKPHKNLVNFIKNKSCSWKFIIILSHITTSNIITNIFSLVLLHILVLSSALGCNKLEARYLRC